jgi:hypothetical protein
MGSNTLPQQQSMGQMPQMAPMQQQDQQSGFAGMYAPQYGANVPMAGGIAMSGGMQGYGGGQVAQGYGGGQSVPNYAMQGNVMPQQQAQYFDPAASNMGSQGNQVGFVAPQIYNPQVSPQSFDPMVSDMSQQGNQVAPVAPQMYNQQVPQAIPNYQVPQVQQQPMAGYGGYAQQPMQYNRYGVAQANKTVLY